MKKKLLYNLLGVEEDDNRAIWKAMKKTHILIIIMIIAMLGMGVTVWQVANALNKQTYSFQKHIVQAQKGITQDSLCADFYRRSDISIFETNNTLLIRTRIVNIRNNNKELTLVDSLRAQGAIDSLNRFFNKTKLRFSLDHVKNIKDQDVYYNIKTREDVKDLDQKYKRSGYFTIYTLGNLTTPSWNGAARDIPSTAVAIKRMFLDKTTLSHEVGHALGLFHTFKSDTSSLGNTPFSGDKVCDTPLNWGLMGAVDDNCEFISGKVPVLSQEAFEILKKNLMSYSSFDCREVFTKGQIDRMYFMVENSDNWRQCIIE